MIKTNSLWGDEIVVNSPKETTDILNKISSTKYVKDDSVEKAIKSKSVSTHYKIDLISSQVKKILGKFADETEVITDKNEFARYIDKAIENGVIAIDTETNNSLDYLNCKIIGLCLYTPNEKSAYIPVNHVNKYTGVRLPNQLTEEDIKRELDRLGITKVIMHNGKFDYQVLKCTCGCKINVYWDTMVGCRIIDENEISASLKYQYAEKIDPSIGRYSIEKLFGDLPYELFSPDIFALYSATDAYMTQRLEDWQLNELNKSENKSVLKLFNNVEMPLVEIVAEMELNGVNFDLEYSERLREKYESRYNELDRKLNDEVNKYKDKIDEWRNSRDGKSLVGKKTKSSQLTNPINLDSPVQLAILLYDVLKVPKVNEEQPRSVDKNALKILEKDHGVEICKILLERKSIKTLLDDFIIKLPKLVNKKDGKIHCNFNQCGKEEKGVVTGRFSSSDPNMQQIPSKNKELRMMFCGGEDYFDRQIDENSSIVVKSYEQIMTKSGWVSAMHIKVGDVILNDEEKYEITFVSTMEENLYRISLKKL